eukprot:17391_1
MNPTYIACTLFSLRFISVLCCSILFVVLLMVNNQTKDQSPKSTRILTYSSMISFMISMAISTMHISIYLLISPETYHNFYVYEIMSNIYYIAWNFGQVFYQILFIMRLFHGFKGTKYQSPPITYIIFIVLVILYGFCCVLEVIYNIFTYSTNYEHRHHIFTMSELDIFGIMYAFGVQAIDLTICFFLLFLFVMKLIDVAVELDDNDVLFQHK